MATMLPGNWRLELRDAYKWSDPLRLQRDLHVTRATLTLPPRTGDTYIWLNVKVNNDPEERMCQLGNLGINNMSVTLDTVYERGASVSFRFIWFPTPGTCAVSVEGWFKQEAVFVASGSTRSTLDSSDGGRSAAEEITRQLQVTGKLLVGEMATTSARLLEHMSSHEDRTSKKLAEMEDRFNKIASQQNSSLEAKLTKQLFDVSKQNAEITLRIDLMNLTQRQAVSHLEEKLNKRDKQQKALEEQLAFFRANTNDLEARNIDLDKK